MAPASVTLVALLTICFQIPLCPRTNETLLLLCLMLLLLLLLLLNLLRRMGGVIVKVRQEEKRKEVHKKKKIEGAITFCADATNLQQQRIFFRISARVNAPLPQTSPFTNTSDVECFRVHLVCHNHTCLLLK